MRTVALLGLLLIVACAGVSAPRGMALAPAGRNTAAPAGAMVVAFPKGACTGSADAVFFDEQGDFVSTVAPGTAASLVLPTGATQLFMVSNFDVEASPGARFFRHHIAVASDRGVILDVPRRDGRNCAGRGVPRPAVVTAKEALAAAEPLVWLEPRKQDGEQWFSEHRARVQELLAAKAPPSTD